MHGTRFDPQLSQPLPRCSHILAFDLGKFNSVLCRFDPATAGHSFVSLATTREAIAHVLSEVAIGDRTATLVVFETCEISGWVYDLVSSMGSQLTTPGTETRIVGWLYRLTTAAVIQPITNGAREH